MFIRLFAFLFLIAVYAAFSFTQSSPLFCTTFLADFAEYWTAAQVFHAKGNAYDPATFFEIQKSLTCRPKTFLPMMMWNPPHAFSFVHVLKFFDYRVAAGLWFSLIILVPTISFFLIRKTLQNFTLNKYKIGPLAILALLSAPPLYYNFIMGQISWLLLAGFAGFLFFTLKKSPNITGSFLGGVCLSITTLKPHLFYLLYIYLAYRSFANKELKTFNGFLIGVILFSIWPIFYYFPAFADYIVFSKNPPVFFKTPTVGSWIQHFFMSDFLKEHKEYKLMIRLLPTAITALSLILALFFTRKRIDTVEKESLVILFLTPLSLLTSPYGWTFDAVLLLPLLMLMMNVHNQKFIGKGNIIAGILLVSNILVYLIPKKEMRDGKEIFIRGLETDVWYLIVILIIAIYYFVTKDWKKAEVS